MHFGRSPFTCSGKEGETPEWFQIWHFSIGRFSSDDAASTAVKGLILPLSSPSIIDWSHSFCQSSRHFNQLLSPPPLQLLSPSPQAPPPLTPTPATPHPPHPPKHTRSPPTQSSLNYIPFLFFHWIPCVCLSWLISWMLCMHLRIYLYPPSCTASFPAAHGFFCFVCFCFCLFSPLQNGRHHRRHHCQCHHHRFARISDSFCENQWFALWELIQNHAQMEEGGPVFGCKICIVTWLDHSQWDRSRRVRRSKTRLGCAKLWGACWGFWRWNRNPPPTHTHTHTHTHTEPRFRSLWSLVSSPHEYSCGMVQDTQMCACSHPFQNVVMWNSSLETNTLLTAHRFLAQKDVVNGQCLGCLLNTPSVKELEP